MSSTLFFFFGPVKKKTLLKFICLLLYSLYRHYYSLDNEKKVKSMMNVVFWCVFLIPSFSQPNDKCRCKFLEYVYSCLVT